MALTAAPPPTRLRQLRLVCVSSDSSASVPTRLGQFRLVCVSSDSSASRLRRSRDFGVAGSSDSSASVPTRLRQFQLVCVSSDSSAPPPTPLRQLRLSCIIRTLPCTRTPLAALLARPQAQTDGRFCHAPPQRDLPCHGPPLASGRSANVPKCLGHPRLCAFCTQPTGILGACFTKST